MSAILEGEPPGGQFDAPAGPQSGARTLLAVTVAASLLLALILGLWSVEPPRVDCAVGSAACDTNAPLVPVGPR
jgi:hypothetical protein